MPEEDLREFAHQLGRLTWNFSALEHKLTWFVAYVSGGSEADWILASSLGFKRLLEAAKTIVHTNLGHEGEFIADFLNAAKLMEQAEAKRNIVVHSSWLVSIDDAGDITRSKTKLRREFLERQLEPMPLPKLAEISDLVESAVRALDALIPRHQKALEWPYGPGKTAERALVQQYSLTMSVVRDANFLLSSLRQLQHLPSDPEAQHHFKEAIEKSVRDDADRLEKAIRDLEAASLREGEPD